MNTKNLPFKLLLIIGVLFACGVLGTGIAMPFANVARDYSPGAVVEANATATAAPVALAPTQTYQERVLPVQQAIEAQEIIETTHKRYENKRTASDVWLYLRIGVGVLALGGAAAFVGSASVERVKRAVEYEPFQVLPDKAVYFPRRARVTHTLTAGTWSMTTDHPADVDHGSLLIEDRAGERIRITPGTGRRASLPVVVEGLEL